MFFVRMLSTHVQILMEMFYTSWCQVTARVGRGDQVMVGGDAALLGRWDPRCAVPLYTTPADYPLWLSKVGVVLIELDHIVRSVIVLATSHW